jgi:hypothetical protein
VSPGAPSPRSPLVLALIFSSPGLALDVKLFHDEITGMISEPLRNNQYIASNANNYDQSHLMYFSAELEL